MSNDIFGHGSSINSFLNNNQKQYQTQSSNLFNQTDILTEADPFNTKQTVDFNKLGGMPALRANDSFNDSADIKFLSLIITELPPYSESQQIGKRDLISRITHSTMSSINDELASCPTGKLTNANLSKMGMDILTVSSTPVSQVDIINGWSTKRHAFMLVLDVMKSFTNERKVISGYTDDGGKITPDFCNGPKVADDLKFVINNITTFKMSSNRATGKTVVSTQSIEHLLTNNTNGFANTNSSVVVNPYSIMTNIADKLEIEGNDALEIRSAGMFPSTSGVLVRREFDHPLNTTRDVINGYHDSLSVSDPTDNESTVYQRAASYHTLKRSVSDPFLRMICNENKVSQSFIWSQLKNWFPEAYSKSKYVKADIKNSMATISSGWNHSSYPAQVAYLISQVVPPVMLKYGILSYSLVLTNKNKDPFTRKCELKCTPSATPGGFYDTNNSQEVIRIIEAINTEITTDLGKMISYGNELEIEAFISYTATESMFIRLRFGDGFGAEEDFVFPAYASSNFSTSVTNNFMTVDNVSTNFKDLISHIDVPDKIKRSMNSTFSNFNMESSFASDSAKSTSGFSNSFFSGS